MIRDGAAIISIKNCIAVNGENTFAQIDLQIMNSLQNYTHRVYAFVQHIRGNVTYKTTQKIKASINYYSV